MNPTSNTTCPLCGGPNGCEPAVKGTFDTPCWCTTTQIDPAALARVPEAQRNKACVCAKCALPDSDGARQDFAVQARDKS